MRGELMFKILSALEEGKDEALDLLGAYLVGGLSYNPIKGKKVAEKFIELRKKAREQKEEQRQITRRFYAMVSYLEKDGLVKKIVETQETCFEITSRGKKKLKDLKGSLDKALPNLKTMNNDLLIEGVIIVTFDVPEKERRKRDWLRNALREVDFQMIHKSVWMGQNGIPESFLENIRDLKLGDFVEIFQITKLGSLRKLN